MENLLCSDRKRKRNVDKDGHEDIRIISYKIKFIDITRFMAGSLSNPVDNLAEGIRKIKCKDCDCFLEYESVKGNLIKYKCLYCNKDCSNKIEELKQQFKNTCKFSNNNIDKFIFLLRIGVYPYEYMDGWKKFNETSLSEKKKNYSNLNMENLTDADFMHAKRV